MQRIKLTLEYEGTDFSGFQIQPSKRTVQREIESSLSKVLGEKIKVFASGRTDAGVHALCQVVHFDTKSKQPLAMLIHETNKLLPTDIAIMKAENVDDDFDARFSPNEKTYIIKFYLSKLDRPLFVNRQVRVSDKINIVAMQESCKYFVGKHNFKSFVARKSGKTDFVREIYSAGITKTRDNQYEFTITGNGFLYNMVRIIFGTILLAGANKITPQEIPGIIQSQNRTMAGKTVSPSGLYLADVKYKKTVK